MKTGKEIWKPKFGEWKESYGGIVAPMIANGVLISGMAGGDRTARGFLDGYDPETGKRLWRTWTIPAPGEKGSETWPNKDIPDAWKYGGGATWQPGSYDPELDLFYVGTGNAEPYNPKYRGGMDSLYAASVLAIRPKTGEMVWYYQYLPNDSFDFDGTARKHPRRHPGRRQAAQGAVQRQQERLPVRDRPDQRQADRRASVRESELGEAHRPQDRPAGADRSARPRDQGRNDRSAPRRGTNATLSAYNPKTGLVLPEFVGTIRGS